MDVLNKALNKYPKPEIFNTDQGSQYTSFIHTQTLKDNGIKISIDSKRRAADNIGEILEDSKMRKNLSKRI